MNFHSNSTLNLPFQLKELINENFSFFLSDFYVYFFFKYMYYLLYETLWFQEKYFNEVKKEFL